MSLQPELIGPHMHSLFPTRSLNSAYDRASAGWHDKLRSLGFVAAYAGLAEAGMRRSGSARAVLDVGCGTGALSQAWVDAGGLRADGALDLLDPSPRMLAQACTRLGAVRPRGVEGGIGTSKIVDACYDVVLCAHVIEHLPDPVDSLVWMVSKLKPGGHLILAVSQPHWCTALVRLRWGSKAWRPCEVLGMLERSNLTDARAYEFEAGPPSRLSCGYVAQA